ncbi:MAG: YlmC/YmxH family sporulation protein [Lachnospirales bacterium]
MFFIISFCELREKEVINICDGSRYGNVADIIFCKNSGQIEFIVIPIGGKFFGLVGSSQEIRIPFCDIEQIGDDLIIVNIDLKKCMFNY